MSNVLKDIYKEFITKKDIASFIKFFSVVTWKKISFVWRSKGLKFHEVTVTQNLLFQFRIITSAFPHVVEMFEANNEKANGNDIELFIKLDHGYAFLPCQAKIASKAGKTGLYKSIDHAIGNTKTKVVKQQIDSLFDYAKSAPQYIDGKRIELRIPIYLFYNFSRNAKALAFISASTTDKVETFGCTYVDARRLHGNAYYNGTKWVKKPSFSNLRIAKPFYTLFNLIGKSQVDIYQKIIEPSASTPQAIAAIVYDQLNKSYPQEDERYSSGWTLLTGDLEDDQVKVDTDQSSEKNQNTEGGFNPKYRIVFNDSELDASIAKWLFV